MNQAQNIMPRLRQLTQLERAQRQLHEGSNAGKSIRAEIESLRDLLPTSILAHHDSFKVRGKPSSAPVSRGICGACHLALPRGRIADLRRGPDDLNVCDNCGVFIYLAEEKPPEADDAAFFKAPAGTKKNKPSKQRPAADAPQSLRPR
ncbi:MAG: C4-type zinc ribbon domain-containing protein [Chthoniobacter sp.]